MAVGAEGVAAFDEGGAVGERVLVGGFSKRHFGEGEDSGSGAYVMRAAVMVWKKSAMEQRALSAKLTILLQRARKPRMRARAAKKPPMRTKANMNRVR